MLNGDIARKKTFHSFKFWLSPFGNYLNSLCYLKMNSKTLQKYHSPGTPPTAPEVVELLLLDEEESSFTSVASAAADFPSV